ncbi:MAG: ABC transporter substrate-binding protein [Thermoplasmata archaeon]
MEKKTLYAIIAVVIVLIVIIAAAAVMLQQKPTTTTSPSPSPSPTPSPTAPTVSASVTTQLGTTNSPITFTASVTGTVSKVTWYFGDGSSATGTVVNHSYAYPGKYLIYVNASGSGGYADNLANMLYITISPSTPSNSTLESEMAQPSMAFNTTYEPNAPILSQGQQSAFLESFLQPPSATNWTVGYYVINYGDGSNSTITPVIYNETSGSFSTNLAMHTFKNTGFYVINFTVVTYNQAPFMKYLVVNNNTQTEYIPSSYYSQVMSGQHVALSELFTVYVASTGQKAGILKASGNIPSPGVINVAEVVPGGPYSFDPAIDYETVGAEIIDNVYETLIQYNASSSSQLIPIVATKVPTMQNGLISPNGLNYTFYVRPGLKFANGDPLTAWDVYTSIVRTLLFMDNPSNPGWILGQDLLPDGGWGTNTYQNITAAMTVNNATDSITFHLLKADPAFLEYVADPLGAGIVDYNWLVQHGAGITFTPQGFSAYVNEGNPSDYNTYVRDNAMGSGPYMIQTYLVGQSIILAPNPNYTPIPGIPGYNKAPTDKVYIQWVKDPETALLMMKSGQSDITEGLPPTYYPTVQSLQAQGKVNIYSFPSLSIFFWVFNWNINISVLHTAIGNNYNLPSHYFANPYVRAAFADAFNYTNYMNNLVGNAIYHANFGFHYVGIIPEGMPGYVSQQWLAAHGATIPQFNLTEAKKLMMESGYYNTTVNIPIIVQAGDPTDFAAAGMLGQNLSQVDPNIHITPVYETWASLIGWLAAPLQNPLTINMLGWAPDFPYPSDYVNAMYLENGTYPGAYGWNYTNLMTWGYTQEAQEWENMTNLIHAAESTANETLALQDFDLAEVIAVNLNLYIYTEQTNQFWFYAPYLHGVQYEENPLYGGGGDTLYFYLTKG